MTVCSKAVTKVLGPTAFPIVGRVSTMASLTWSKKRLFVDPSLSGKARTHGDDLLSSHTTYRVKLGEELWCHFESAVALPDFTLLESFHILWRSKNKHSTLVFAAWSRNGSPRMVSGSASGTSVSSKECTMLLEFRFSADGAVRLSAEPDNW